MRFLGARVVALAALVLWSGLPHQKGDDPEQLLSKARAHLGGARLATVKALEVDRDGTTIRMQFPDRLQLEFQTSFGPSITTLAADTVWQLDPPTPTRRAQQAPPPMASLVKRERQRLAEFAAMYLLRPIGAEKFQLRDLGVQEFWTLSGRVLELQLPDLEPARLVLDPATAHPLALVWRRRVPPSPEICDLVARLEDYREVNGIRMPFSIRWQIVNQGERPNRDLARYRSAYISINPSFDPALFQKRAPAQ